MSVHGIRSFVAFKGLQQSALWGVIRNRRPVGMAHTYNAAMHIADAALGVHSCTLYSRVVCHLAALVDKGYTIVAVGILQLHGGISLTETSCRRELWLYHRVALCVEIAPLAVITAIKRTEAFDDWLHLHRGGSSSAASFLLVVVVLGEHFLAVLVDKEGMRHELMVVHCDARQTVGEVRGTYPFRIQFLHRSVAVKNHEGIVAALPVL